MYVSENESDVALSATSSWIASRGSSGSIVTALLTCVVARSGGSCSTVGLGWEDFPRSIPISSLVYDDTFRKGIGHLNRNYQ